MSEETVDILDRMEAAWQLVCDIAAGRKDWTMKIPAKPRSDTDLVLTYALRDGKAEIERLRADNERLTRLAEVSDALRERLEVATPILKEFARRNPIWIDYSGQEHDPMGAHSLLSALEAQAAPEVKA